MHCRDHAAHVCSKQDQASTGRLEDKGNAATPWTDRTFHPSDLYITSPEIIFCTCILLHKDDVNSTRAFLQQHL